MRAQILQIRNSVEGSCAERRNTASLVVEGEAARAFAWRIRAALWLLLAAMFFAGSAAGQDQLSHAGGRVEERPRMLVEDNPVNQRLTTRMLEKRGHRVVLAGNGIEAQEVLAKGPFDLVLMDVQMPEMDGLQATAVIREKEKGTGTHLPIVALTAHAMKGDKEMCLAAGNLSKPIRPGELDDVLERYLARRAELVSSGAGQGDKA